MIENVAGAGGNIGVGRLARAAPDGYTIGIGQWSTHVVNAVTYSLPYDVLHDFEPIALLTIAPQWLIARSALPVNDLKELIAWLKANPDKGSLGTVGVGSPSHVFGVHFQNQTGTRLSFVPYRGGAPALQDLVAGQIDLSMLEASSTLPSVRDGRIKALAVLDKARWASAPEVPTADEAGIPGLHMPFWHGFWVPRECRKR